VREAAAINLAEVLRFQASELSAKKLTTPDGPFGQLCVPGVPDETDVEWLPLLQMAAQFGWRVDPPLPI
jgi:hypothetical protein